MSILMVTGIAGAQHCAAAIGAQLGMEVEVAAGRRPALAIPVQVNFALSGTARIVREIRSALHRRERELLLARKAAATAMETELKTTVAGLLLHSQLVLANREVPSPLAEHLRMVAELAGSLSQQLSALLHA